MGVAGAALHRLDLPRRRARGDDLGLDRRRTQGHPQRQRGDLDDHAQLHRQPADLLPAARTLESRRRDGRRDRSAATSGTDPQPQQLVRGDRVPLPGQRHPAGVPADRHRSRDRLPRRAQSQPIRFRPAGVRSESGSSQGIGHQPEANGAADVPDLRRHRRIDRPRPAARRPAVRQVRRPVPPGPRLHRPVAGPARAQPSRRHRRRGGRLGDDRAGDAAPQLHRHPPGDRHHPPGFLPACRRGRLRGRAPQGRRGRDESDGPANADADGASSATRSRRPMRWELLP